MPIQALLSRIRWDKEFAQGEFAIGYFDRIGNEVVIVPFKRMQLMPGDHYFAFRFVDEAGETHAVPFHRIREVRKNGEVIWQRP